MITLRIAILTILLAAGTLASVHAAPGARDLWIAVLLDELLVPVGALVDGTWRFDTAGSADTAGHEAMREQVGKRPIRWPSAGRLLPTTWRAHVTRGRKVAHVAEPIEAHPAWEEHFGVRTDLWLPGARPGDPSTIHGVAVVGDVTVRLFAPLAAGSRREALMRFLDAPAVAAARKAVAIARSAAEAGSPWKTVPDEAVVNGSFEIEESRSIEQADGSTLFYVEASKAPVEGCEVHVRATVTAPRGGDFRLGAIDGTNGCDNYVNLSPIASVERGGAVCWVSREIYEDGFVFLLRSPDIVPTGTSACAIR